MIDIDTATGLPTLPEGYFWRVRESYKGSPNIRVEIRKRRPIGSTVIDFHPVKKSDASEKAIKRAAKWAMEWVRKSEQNQDSWTKFIGDYPPKSLDADV